LAKTLPIGRVGASLEYLPAAEFFSLFSREGGDDGGINIRLIDAPHIDVAKVNKCGVSNGQ
jgi:hypothetical protein